MLTVLCTVHGPTLNVVVVSTAVLNVPSDATSTGIATWPLPTTGLLVLGQAAYRDCFEALGFHDCGVVADRTSEGLPRVSNAEPGRGRARVPARIAV